MKPTFFKSSSEFRRWLESNHDRMTELVVGFYKKATGKPSITYPEALDEALCIGWIDGVRKSYDDTAYMIRFSPRREKSVWSRVNTKRAEELIALGRMKPPGLAAFERRDKSETARLYSYESKPVGLAPSYLKKLKANKAAWAFFQAQPPGYRRTLAFWVMRAKQEETRRRLARLIKQFAKGAPVH